MLLDLKVVNLVLIEFVHLSFDKGFTVFTGETGTGKSLLVKAIKLLLGEKGGSHYLRQGAKEGEIEALIWGGEKLYKKLQEMGYTPSEEIHLKRIFSPHRQKVYLNGSPATLNELSHLTKDLIILTSQHEFYTLLSPEKQLEFIDQFLGLTSELKEYQNLFLEYKNLRSQLKVLEEKLSQTQLKKEFLLFQIKEIEELKPNPDEEKHLLEERKRLKNLTLLKERTNFLLQLLNQIEENFSRLLSPFQSLSQLEPNFKENFLKVNSLYYEIKDIQRDLKTYFDRLPEDDTSLNEIEERLFQYDKIKRKYRRDAEGILKLLEELKEELSLLESGEERLEELKKEEEKLESKLIDKAKKLGEERLKGIPKLQSLLKRELKDLGIEKAEFKIELKSLEPKVENLSFTGLEEVNFLFSSNPGVPLKPLEKVASGGELSRFFLACKALLREGVEAGTLIFDEVDSGIGGVTAKKVAQKLKELSHNYQILCITHLPQIAVLADTHYVVEKELAERETKTRIKKLEREDRIKEIARMLGASELSNFNALQSFLKNLGFSI
ncbi:MAG: DNA repair protein RecN [Thermodesulfobacteriaceae bacterium]|nr:DNA repair protein RecN [Thermodesulfobacteriaceae bacterium]MCX8042166.1 DNA repair protein RecN [Thermodesulfobacteriaceae bacterium]MDW8136521.1 DNA repair protein RecN [Thermodesulfobacterium sp.]